MKEAAFRYKCRMCGVTYDESFCGQEHAFRHLITIEAGRPVDGIPTRMTGIHHCSGYTVEANSNLGVSDLIGVEMRGSDDSA